MTSPGAESLVSPFFGSTTANVVYIFNIQILCLYTSKYLLTNITRQNIHQELLRNMSGRGTKKRKFDTSFYAYVSGQTEQDVKSLLKTIEMKDVSISSHSETITRQTGVISRQARTIRKLQATITKQNKKIATDKEAHTASIGRLRRELEKYTILNKKTLKTRHKAQRNAKNAISDITTKIMAANERKPESLGFLTRIHQQLVDVLTDAQIQIITLEAIKEKSITHEQRLKASIVQICKLKQDCVDLKEENNMFKNAFNAHSAASALVMKRIEDID